MLKGAFIFAAGATAGLVVGSFTGLILGFKVADNVNKVSIGTPPEEKSDGTISLGQEDAS